jgi:IS605 OrfB family transposase
MQSTFETKLKLTKEQSDILLEQARQLSTIERRIFVRLYVKKEDANQVKRDTLQYDGITGRQYNAILYSLKGRISNLRENNKFQIENISGHIKSISEKIEDLEEELKAKTIDEEKRKKLRFVLHQKKRRKAILESRLEAVRLEMREPIPALCFGSRKLFNAQHHLEVNGYASAAEWREDWDFQRNNQFALIGSKDEIAGNQSAQLDLMSQRLKLRLTNSLAQKYGEKYLTLSSVSFAYGQERIEAALSEKRALYHRLVARKRDHEIVWYLKTSLEEPEQPLITNAKNGIIGVDFNANHFALGYVSGDGNPLGESKIQFEVTDKTSGQIKAALGEAVKEIVDQAIVRQAPIAVEELDFTKKKTELRERGVRYARMLSGFAYGLFFILLSRRAARYGVEVRRRNPAYTSIIGAVKYSAGYGLSTDGGAAIAIGRRGLKMSESLSTRAKSPFLDRILIEASTQGKGKHVWSGWSQVKKRLGPNRKRWPGRCSEERREAKSIEISVTTKGKKTVRKNAHGLSEKVSRVEAKE